MTFLPQLLRILRESRKLMLGSILCGLAFSAIGLIPPLVIRRLIQLLDKGDLTGSVIFTMVGLLLGLSLVRGCLRYGYGVFSHIAAYRTLHRLICKTFAHIQNLPPGTRPHRRSGKLMSQAVSDVEMMEDFIAHGIPESLLAIVIPIAMIVVLFVINPILALMVLIPLPLAAYAMYRISSRTNRSWRQVRGYRADLVAEILDREAGNQVVKSFVQEDAQVQQIRAFSARYRDGMVRANFWSLIPPGFVETASGIGYVLVIGCGGYHAMRGQLDVADLVVFIVYMAQIFMPLLRLANLNEVLQKAAASAQRVFELLDSPIETDAQNVGVPTDIGWDVEFQNVTFGYDPAEPVLNDVNFSAPAGQVVALVGPTGAGKTTVSNLVPRFHDTQGGTVTIGGHDVRALPLRHVRKNVSHVMQDVFLFHTTIWENIRFGYPDATDEQIRQAARAANAEDFILQLPQGYDTVVGERGARLSGGEKQRVSIARALLKDAPILILDEATSSVDAESEAEIQEALSRLIVGRTVIVIAHRLSTIRNADRIVVLQDGHVAETGIHDELMELNGPYARMFSAQLAAQDWQVRSV